MTEPGPAPARPFYGKYRGKVERNVDPSMRGRVEVSCPAVLGDGNKSWAQPCMPFSGQGVGIFAVPPTGASVWIEFEAGNPDRPILAGGFWEIGQSPAIPAVEQITVVKRGAIALTLTTLPGIGGFKLAMGPPEAAVPAGIEANALGMTISWGTQKIVLSPLGVSINNGALLVTP
jgi:hypothetical protein